MNGDESSSSRDEKNNYFAFFGKKEKKIRAVGKLRNYTSLKLFLLSHFDSSAIAFTMVFPFLDILKAGQKVTCFLIQRSISFNPRNVL